MFFWIGPETCPKKLQLLWISAPSIKTLQQINQPHDHMPGLTFLSLSGTSRQVLISVGEQLSIMASETDVSVFPFCCAFSSVLFDGFSVLQMSKKRKVLCILVILRMKEMEKSCRWTPPPLETVPSDWSFYAALA